MEKKEKENPTIGKNEKTNSEQNLQKGKPKWKPLIVGLPVEKARRVIKEMQADKGE